MKKKLLYYFAWAFVILGLMVTGFYLFELNKDNWSVFGPGKIDIEKTGQIGDYVGGFIGTIVSVSGFIFLYLTLKEQREAVKKERFETKFYELLQIHRSNVSEIRLEQGHALSKVSISGRDVIKKIVECVLDSREDMKMFFRRVTESDIYEDVYATKLKANLKLTNPNVDLVKLAKVNFAYCIVFYGLEAEGKRALERLFRKKYKPTFYNPIINYLGLRPQKDHIFYRNWLELNQISPAYVRKKVANGILSRRRSDFDENQYNARERAYIENLWYRNEFEKHYTGFQSSLSHYFRHLFQTVKFIHNEPLSYEEKYFFMKTLRAQLSTHEQVLLFINSLSFMGMPWELIPSFVWSETIDDRKRALIKNSMFITNYKLIKNIPNENHFGFNVQDFYPNLKIEAAEQEVNTVEIQKKRSFIQTIKLVYNYYRSIRQNKA